MRVIISDNRTYQEPESNERVHIIIIMGDGGLVSILCRFLWVGGKTLIITRNCTRILGKLRSRKKGL